MEKKDLEQTQNAEIEQTENAGQTATEETAVVEENVKETMVEETPAQAEKPKAVKEKKQKTKKEKNKKKTEEDLSQYEGLSDDELYAKIQTQKLLKRKQQKRVATMIGMCVAFVLALVIIVLAAVPVSLKPNCMEKGFYSVGLYPGTTTQGGAFSEGDAEYKQFMKAYDKAFSQSYIAAIFSGSLFSYDIEEKLDSVSSVIGAGGSLVANNQYYVRLRYADEQRLTNRNGKAYKSRYSNSTWDGKLTFTEVYFEVNQKAGVQETKVYVVAKGYPSSSSETSDTTKEYIVTITVKADTHAIYNVWSDLTK